MNRTDPYDPPSESLYECLYCGARTRTEERVETCGDCGGKLKNLTVPRDQ